LFQGQEFAASSPFLYFADHKAGLAREILRGRAEFVSQFRRLDRPSVLEELCDPAELATFARCKLDLSERERHAAIYSLHKDLIALRKWDPAFQQQRHRGVDGAVLGERAFVLRFFVGDTTDRLLLVNLGCDLHLDQAPEPLLAPSPGYGWDILLSTEDRLYGGEGTPPVETLDGWRLMGEAAIVLKQSPRPNPTAANEIVSERKRRARTKLGE
jgi:maltooligosyltrehalose trehalohydrolase